MININEKRPNGPGNDPDTKIEFPTRKHNMFRLDTVNIYKRSRHCKNIQAIRRHLKTLQMYKGIEKDYPMVDNNEKLPNGPGNDPDTKTEFPTCKNNMFRLDNVNI